MKRTAFCLVLLTGLFVLQVRGEKPPQETRQAFLKMQDRPRVKPEPQVLSEKETKGFVEQSLTIATEKKADGKLERMPILTLKKPETKGRIPTVIMLHGTGGSKELMRPWLEEFANRGWLAVAIDARYHADRANGKKGSEAYNEAITKAWQTPRGTPQEHPFYYDTVWDLWRLVDYLVTRDDVDPANIAMVGISMGGIQTWLAASVDERVKVIIPLIGVQSFRWSLDNNRWHARAKTIQKVHEAAARDLGEKEVNAKVCEVLWNKLIPGILDDFDCPNMLKLCAPRPLLILNGEKDPNCPIEGARIAFASADKAYSGNPEKIRHIEAAGVAHSVPDEFKKETLAWLERWLK
jgi:dienelactone hydrolase